MWAVELKDGLLTDIWFTRHNAVYQGEVWRKLTLTRIETSAPTICQRKQVNEGYTMLSQSKHPSYFESLNRKKPERRESSDPNGKNKDQRLFFLTMVTGAHNFLLVLLRLMFWGEYKC